MMTTQTMPTTAKTDTQLVEWSLTGDRDAFRQIVERYQSLVCSITYNATGSLSVSEDLAQETFVAAWKQLPELRDPSLLRSWLCGITRFLVGKEFRRQGREPIHAAEPLEATYDLPSPDPSPASQAVTHEEEAILWRALERIPDAYREPLILFYREHQSVERVAVELELSEDAVKQRLARGRKLLHEKVIAFVEGTLTKTAPGQQFSLSVMAVLPMAAISATATVAGAGTKGTAAAKSGFLAAWLAPFIGIFAGIASQWLMIRAGATGRDRRARLIEFIVAWIFALGFSVGGEYAVRILGRHLQWSEQTFFVAKAGFWWFFATVVATWITIVYRRSQARPQPSQAAGEVLQPAMMPLKPGTLALVVAGTHLMLLWCVIFLAWMAQDRITAGIIVGIMLTLGIWQFFHARGKTGAAAARAYIGQLAVCSAVMLAILNLRFDVWAASWYGISVAELHHRLPIWIVPLLTLTLLLWSGLFLALTKPKRRS